VLNNAEMTDFISPDSVESPKSTLLNLAAGQAVYISDSDFKTLTGDKITEFGSEGRLAMGNLSAFSNCTIDTTSGIAVFTKNSTRPITGLWRPTNYRLTPD
jgi:hypothetical protein